MHISIADARRLAETFLVEKGQCVRINGGNQPGYLVAYRAVNAATIPPLGANYGLLIIALNLTSFVPLTQFKTEVDKLIARVKENRRETGVTEILIPGERAYRQRETHLVSGIHLDNTLVSQLT